MCINKNRNIQFSCEFNKFRILQHHMQTQSLISMKSGNIWVTTTPFSRNMLEVRCHRRLVYPAVQKSWVGGQWRAPQPVFTLSTSSVPVWKKEGKGPVEYKHRTIDYGTWRICTQKTASLGEAVLVAHEDNWTFKISTRNPPAKSSQHSRTTRKNN